MVDDYVQLYRAIFDLHDTRFTKITHSDSIVAIVYKIQRNDGTNCILKICEQPEHYYKELYFLRLFADKLPVPRIIKVAPPAKNIHGAILMECLQGEILAATNLTPTLGFTIGALLAQIHQYRTVEFGDPTKPKSLLNDPRTYFAAKFNESFSECRKGLSSKLLSKCALYYQRNHDHLLAVDGPCIIHRDFRPGNVLVHKGHVSGIIDWASGRFGFAEDDLCSVEIGEWGRASFAPRIAILRGYQSVRPLPNYSAVMPLLILNRALAVIGFTVKMGTWNNRDADLYQHYKGLLQQMSSKM